MHLFLIRHGKYEGNVRNDHGGRIDQGLDTTGHQQAATLATWIPGNLPPVDVLYTSTLLRAKETAAYLAEVTGQTTREDDRLRELESNRLDHSPWPNDDIPARRRGVSPLDHPLTALSTTPGQESWMHFRVRVAQFLEEIIAGHKNEVVMVVCHGGVINAMFDHVLNSGPWRRCFFAMDNTSVSYLEHGSVHISVQWILHYFNRTDHLR